MKKIDLNTLHILKEEVNGAISYNLQNHLSNFIRIYLLNGILEETRDGGLNQIHKEIYQRVWDLRFNANNV